MGAQYFIGVVLDAMFVGIYFVTSLERAAPCRMVKARTGGGLSLLDVCAFRRPRHRKMPGASVRGTDGVLSREPLR